MNMDNSKLQHICNTIVNSNKQQRLGYFHFIDTKTAKYIREIAVNILINDSFEFTDKEKQYLKRKLGHIRQIASRYTSIYKKREIFVAQHLLLKKLAAITLRHISDSE